MSEWHPPTEAEKEAVSRLARQAIAGMRVACAERDRIAGQHLLTIVRPLPDVALKGDALRASRAARGCSVPVPEPVPEPWPEHEEALF